MIRLGQVVSSVVYSLINPQLLSRRVRRLVLWFNGFTSKGSRLPRDRKGPWSAGSHWAEETYCLVLEGLDSYL